MKYNQLLLGFAFIWMFGESCKKDQYPATANDQNPATALPATTINYQSKYRYGVVEIGTAAYNALPALIENITSQGNTNGLSVLPKEYYLECPPIADQGREGSCVGFAVAYSALSIMYKYKAKVAYDNALNIFSPEWLYDFIKLTPDCGSGSRISDALKFLNTIGCVPWNRMPYTDRGCTFKTISPIDIGVAAARRVREWETMPFEVGAFQKQIAIIKRPIIVAIQVDQAFENLYNGQIYKSYKGPLLGGHAIAIIGYSDAMHAFKIMNQWGTSWGSDGFGWIDYNIIANKNFLREAYIITSVL